MNNQNPISNEKDWVWLRRNTQVIKQFDTFREMQEERARIIVFPLLAQHGLIADHVYEEAKERENIVIHRSFLTEEWRKLLGELGWKEKKRVKEYVEERKEFYDALLKGGSLH